MKKQGRPPLPPEERKVSIYARVPKNVYEFCKAQGNASEAVRIALELYMKEHGHG
jgi:hypothetical protein